MGGPGPQVAGLIDVEATQGVAVFVTDSSTMLGMTGGVAAPQRRRVNGKGMGGPGPQVAGLIDAEATQGVAVFVTDSSTLLGMTGGVAKGIYDLRLRAWVHKGRLVKECG